MNLIDKDLVVDSVKVRIISPLKTDGGHPVLPQAGHRGGGHQVVRESCAGVQHYHSLPILSGGII